MSSVPPGWYDDGSGQKRWWAGDAWTDHVHAAVPPTAAYVAPLAPEPGRRQGGVSKWVWIGSGAAVVVLGGTAVVAAAIAALTAGPVSAAKDAVALYDHAWLTIDCDELWDATTQNFRDEWEYPDCATFEIDARAFDEASLDYEISVEKVTRHDDTITVVTTESSVGDDGYSAGEMTYTVVPDGDTWRIDSVTFPDDDGNGQNT